MTDKQLETKKEEFYKGFVDPEYYNIDDELPNSEYGEWLRDPDDVWQWISKLVEEVERETKEIDRKLMEKVADSDYQFGFIRGTQTSESLTPLRISEHEEERKKIRKEMMERFYN